MNLDGVRNAKAEVFQDVFGFRAVATMSAADRGTPLFLPVAGTAAHRDMLSGRKKNKKDPRDMIAIGVLPPDGHNQNPDEMVLGIFIQRQDLRQHPIVEKAQRLARGETRVVYTGRPTKRALNTARHRPVVAGGSTGHHRVTAGTIGCFCRHHNGGIGILSNNHVLADTNKAMLGDVILQPGPVDGGRKNDANSRIGNLYKFIPIDLNPGSRNLVDCAFATLLSEIHYDCATVTDPANAANSWTIGAVKQSVDILDPVHKVGRTTGYTEGEVTAIEIDNLTVAMVLGTGERLARFDRQIAFESKTGMFSDAGDSGSLICTKDGSPAALLFAGTPTGGTWGHGVTYGNPIRNVLDALQIEIHTGGKGGQP